MDLLCQFLKVMQFISNVNTLKRLYNQGGTQGLPRTTGITVTVSSQVSYCCGSCYCCCVIRVQIRIYITQANRGALYHRDCHYNQFRGENNCKLLLWYLICNQGGNQGLRYINLGVAMDHREPHYNQFPSQNNGKILLWL